MNGRRGVAAPRQRGHAEPGRPGVLATAGTQNVPNLTGRVDTHGYLSPVSDIVALLTFEHQTQMTNLITRLGWEARIALNDSKTAAITPAHQSRIDALVAYMLFADEPPLGDPGRGSRLSRGRSRNADRAITRGARCASSTCALACFAIRSATWCTTRRSMRCRARSWTRSTAGSSTC